MRIVDSLTGDSLLNAYLLESAYMASNVPGYAGMVQGYVDIPPDFAGGIDNFIGSSFLQGLGASRDAGDWVMLWFYADQALFDALGNSLIPEVGITGTFTIGIAVAEPPAIVLFGMGTIGALIILYRRRRRECVDLRQAGACRLGAQCPTRRA